MIVTDQVEDAGSGEGEDGRHSTLRRGSREAADWLGQQPTSFSRFI